MKKASLLVVVLLMLVAIPATVFLVGRNQELRKRAAPATSLSLTPSSINKKVGDVFSVEVTIDTGPNQVVAAELHLVFDPTKLEAQTITNGSLFPNILASGIVDRGTASITVGAASATKPVTGTGATAVVKFKALDKTDAPISIRFAANTFVGSLGEGSNNVLTGTTPASVTITGTGGIGGAPIATPSGALTQTTPTPTIPSGQTPKPTPTPVLLTPTPTKSASPSAQASVSAVLITAPAKDSSVTKTTPTISGKAAPGATITITIYSTPQTVVVTADASGNWSYTPVTPLDPGPHNVVATATSLTGGTQTTTTSFVVAAGGQAGATQSAQPVSGTVAPTYILLAVAVLLLISGVAVPLIIR